MALSALGWQEKAAKPLTEVGPHLVTCTSLLLSPLTARPHTGSRVGHGKGQGLSGRVAWCQRRSQMELERLAASPTHPALDLLRGQDSRWWWGREEVAEGMCPRPELCPGCHRAPPPASQGL